MRAPDPPEAGAAGPGILGGLGPIALHCAAAAPAGLVSALRIPPCLCSEGPALLGRTGSFPLLHMEGSLCREQEHRFGARQSWFSLFIH